MDTESKNQFIASQLVYNKLSLKINWTSKMSLDQGKVSVTKQMPTFNCGCRESVNTIGK